MVVPTDSETLITRKKEKSYPLIEDMEDPQAHTVKWKKILMIWHSEESRTMETEKGYWLLGTWVEGWDFYSSEAVLYDMVMTHLLKPTECTTQRINPIVNHGLELMPILQSYY